MLEGSSLLSVLRRKSNPAYLEGHAQGLQGIQKFPKTNPTGIDQVVEATSETITFD